MDEQKSCNTYEKLNTQACDYQFKVNKLNVLPIFLLDQGIWINLSTTMNYQRIASFTGISFQKDLFKLSIRILLLVIAIFLCFVVPARAESVSDSFGEAQQFDAQKFHDLYFNLFFHWQISSLFGQGNRFFFG